MEPVCTLRFATLPLPEAFQCRTQCPNDVARNSEIYTLGDDDPVRLLSTRAELPTRRLEAHPHKTLTKSL